MKKFLLTTSNYNPKLDFELEPVSLNKGLLKYDQGCVLEESKDALHLGDGYILDCTDEITSTNNRRKVALQEITQKWPLSESITGSFAIATITQDRLYLSNDSIGFYPLFYYLTNDQIIVSNDLFLVAQCLFNFVYDQIGIAQKAIGIENSNVGARTIIKGVKRLLPGERITISTQNYTKECDYDNTLYNTSFKFDLSKESLKDYWAHFQKETHLLLEDQDTVHVALSGGMDSRIILASIQDEIKKESYTYGKSSSYEVKIAAQLAQLVKSKFKSFYFPKLYFPSKNLLKKKVLQSGSIRIASWLEILENTASSPQEHIMLGDMCEVLPARNIERFSSRESRVKSFFKMFILRSPIQLEKSTEKSFSSWKDNYLNRIIRAYPEHKFNNLNLDISYDDLIDGIKKDYRDLFERIKSHQLPYAELYSEMIAFYTHARQPMGQQILNCNSDFKAVSPAMSLRNMRLATSIPPQIRLGYRFMNKMFRVIPELKKFNKIPASQSPYVHRSLPDALIMIVWGIRSKIDQYLIKRLMRRRDPSLRYRLFEGLNWIDIYQMEGVKDKFDAYFQPSDKMISPLVLNYSELLEDRITLKAWPFSNVDLLGLASLNIELEELNKIKDQNP